MRRTLPLSLVVTAALLLTGCAADPTPEATEDDGLRGEVTVSAAASLQAAFTDIAAAFTAEHPDVTIVPSYDGSSTLATQIIEGAAVDVFASADEPNMAKVTAAGLASDPAVFATNTLTLVVPTGNPGGIESLDDLADPAKTVVLCAAEVPCGAASAQLLDAAGVTASVDSYEQNVTAVLTKVAAGEADAGLVYVTDAAIGAGDVESVATEGAGDVVNRYPIAVLDASADDAAADAFVAFVTGAKGQDILSGYGFGAP